ncbi:MAG: hypothetical protein HN348_29735 [Proteobacteria bacterium]|nr:hypothetical protein [Pseudomonadota bacterium]
MKQKHFRARWYVRPRLAFVGLANAWTMTGGAVVGHQWWAIKESLLRPVGETQLVGGTVLRGMTGHDVSLVSTAGAWLGPVGLLGGPMLRFDRLTKRGTGLAAAWSMGPTVRLVVKVGIVSPWLSATPTWILHGREGLPGAPVDEMELGGGVQISGRPVTVRLSGSYRATEAKARWDAVLGLHLRLL